MKKRNRRRKTADDEDLIDEDEDEIWQSELEDSCTTCSNSRCIKSFLINSVLLIYHF